MCVMWEDSEVQNQDKQLGNFLPPEAIEGPA